MVCPLIGLMYAHFGTLHYFVEQIARVKLPAIYDAEEFVEAGGLLSLSANFVERYRAAAGHFRGAKIDPFETFRRQSWATGSRVQIVGDDVFVTDVPKVIDVSRRSAHRERVPGD